MMVDGEPMKRFTVAVRRTRPPAGAIKFRRNEYSPAIVAALVVSFVIIFCAMRVLCRLFVKDCREAIDRYREVEEGNASDVNQQQQ